MAVTLIALVPPTHTVPPTGCVVMVGSATTVTIAALDVTAPQPVPDAFTITLYCVVTVNAGVV